VFVVVLAAGEPFRGTAPSLLQTAPDRRRFLDWLIDAFDGLHCSFRVVAGYRFDTMSDQLGNVDVVVEPHWRAQGATGSLLRGLPVDASCFVVYSDILFRRSLVAAVQAASHEADLVLTVDTMWRRRFVGRAALDIATAEKVRLSDDRTQVLGIELMDASADAEFVGLAYLSPDIVAHLRNVSKVQPACAQWPLPRLFAYLLEEGYRVRAVDALGDWATWDEPQDLARFVLGSKAQTLQRLAGIVKQSVVPPLVVISYRAWLREPDATLADLARFFGGGAVAVRSSAVREDGWASSMAGAFTSLLNVPADQSGSLRRAIDEVFESYDSLDAANEVLVQSMTPKASVSGVVLTRTLSHGAPYLIVNYNDVSAGTDRVTSGVDFSGKTLYCHHTALDSLNAEAPVLGRLSSAVREVVSLVGHDSLDIEFAADEGGNVNLLQVRPIAAHSGNWRGDDKELDDFLAAGEALFSKLQVPTGPVVGRRTVLSVMTDWNPAEMIGLRPRRLAFDLYRYLLTDAVWARQRAEFGYRDLQPTPLMVSLAGYAYIDVRATLNSFVPAALPDRIAEYLVDTQIEHLVGASDKHDKVEFEIATTCFDFAFSAHRTEMRAAGMCDADLDRWAVALHHLTSVAMNPARLEGLDADLNRLEARRSKLRRGPPLKAALALLDDCCRLGTPAFAHYARHAFVATALLRSAVREGVLPADAEGRFLAGIMTVAGELTVDSNALATGKMTQRDFLDKYGHLRPGPYNITVPSYREAPERYLSNLHSVPSCARASGWADGEGMKFSRALAAIDLPDEIEQVEKWMRRAIVGRERAKHIFTRNLSEAIDLIRQHGNALGVDCETLSHLGLDDLRVMALDSTLANDRVWLGARAERNAAAFQTALRVELPPLISDTRDFRIFHQSEAIASYIGSAEVVAEACDLETAESPGAVRGRIVLIRQADPGYDWIFAHAPVGLVTAYGGANSHMTIRAAELRLPAAIGVGESVFEKLRSANLLRLDCAMRRVELLH